MFSQQMQIFNQVLTDNRSLFLFLPGCLVKFKTRQNMLYFSSHFLYAIPNSLPGFSDSHTVLYTSTRADFSCRDLAGFFELVVMTKFNVGEKRCDSVVFSRI